MARIGDGRSALSRPRHAVATLYTLLYSCGGCQPGKNVFSLPDDVGAATDNKPRWDKWFSLSAPSRLIGILRTNFTVQHSVLCTLAFREPIFIMIWRKYVNFQESHIDRLSIQFPIAISMIKSVIVIIVIIVFRLRWLNCSNVTLHFIYLFIYFSG